MFHSNISPFHFYPHFEKLFPPPRLTLFFFLALSNNTKLDFREKCSIFGVAHGQPTISYEATERENILNIFNVVFERPLFPYLHSVVSQSPQT